MGTAPAGAAAVTSASPSGTSRGRRGLDHLAEITGRRVPGHRCSCDLRRPWRHRRHAVLAWPVSVTCLEAARDKRRAS
jgi:hypothetical protein